MESKQSIQVIQKTIKFEKDLVDVIEHLATNHERDFSKQVKFMLRDYIRIKEYI